MLMFSFRILSQCAEFRPGAELRRGAFSKRSTLVVALGDEPGRLSYASDGLRNA